MIYFEKSYPAPPSLAAESEKASGKYTKQDVIDALHNDFNNKCYLCEDSHLTAINVEHFHPHGGRKDLKFSWDNLYLSCAHCNGIKHDRTDILLNCTDPNSNVEYRVQYFLNPFPRERATITALEDDEVTINTVRLLQEIFDGNSPIRQLESSNLRSRVLQELRRFVDLLFEYEDAEGEVKDLIRIKIGVRLSPRSEFVSFKRWFLRNHCRADEYLEDFGEFFT